MTAQCQLSASNRRQTALQWTLLLLRPFGLLWSFDDCIIIGIGINSRRPLVTSLRPLVVIAPEVVDHRLAELGLVGTVGGGALEDALVVVVVHVLQQVVIAF